MLDDLDETRAGGRQKEPKFRRRENSIVNFEYLHCPAVQMSISTYYFLPAVRKARQRRSVRRRRRQRRMNAQRPSLSLREAGGVGGWARGSSDSGRQFPGCTLDLFKRFLE